MGTGASGGIAGVYEIHTGILGGVNSSNRVAEEWRVNKFCTHHSTFYYESGQPRG